MHYNDALDIWEKVVTELIGENEGEIYYQAFPSEFSPFAIVGIENIDTSSEYSMPSASETTETISDQVDKEVTSTPKTIERKYVWIGLLAGIVLLGILRIKRVI